MSKSLKAIFCCYFIARGTMAFAGCGVLPDEREIIQGPFSTPMIKGAEISVVPSDEKGGIALVLNRPSQSGGEKDRYVVDVYEEDGGISEVETILFQPVKGVKNVVVLISRKVCLMALGTHGRYYEIHSYEPTPKGTLAENEVVKYDRESSGMDGFSEGEPVVFVYKNAELIRWYLEKFK
ncbi:hypothetical protein KSS93_17835 [Pseudomonas xanthosomatis]|uniref:hypothetical protein n=1 Tax=Pseudomonas xanthosomatis TaxID=2842356 RepID=UPI001C3C99A6|nr:hypothetical protein [Pseudomonas xanthosomatis]QXH44742.1 hypothetical protein KSS93_17835 [Pseudomonas xanthosomatis]